MLGEIIRQKRKTLGITQRELARLANVNISRISDIEAEKYKRISERTFLILKQYLDIDDKEFIKLYVNTDKNFGEIIKQERIKRHLKINDICKMTGLSYETIKKVEMGDISVSEQTILKLIDALHLTSIDHCCILNTENSKNNLLLEMIYQKIANLNSKDKLEFLNSFLDILKDSSKNELESMKQKLKKN